MLCCIILFLRLVETKLCEILLYEIVLFHYIIIIDLLLFEQSPRKFVGLFDYYVNNVLKFPSLRFLECGVVKTIEMTDLIVILD